VANPVASRCPSMPSRRHQEDLHSLSFLCLPEELVPRRRPLHSLAEWQIFAAARTWPCTFCSSKFTFCHGLMTGTHRYTTVALSLSLFRGS
jgi:hypothetical protein